MMGDPAISSSLRMFRIKVTQIIDPQCFMARIGTKPDMETYLDQEESLHKLGKELSEEPVNLGVSDDTVIGDLVLAYSSSWAKWVRAQVNFIDSEHGEVDVICVDYGTTELVKVSEVICQPNEVMTVWPQHVHQCTLAAVQPIANVWIKRATSHFQSLVLNQDLICQVVEEDPQGRVVVKIYYRDDSGNQMSVSEKLHREGFAKMTESDSNDIKIPSFSVQQLHQAPSQLPTETDQCENGTDVNDDIETQLYLKALGTTEDDSPWVRSDVTIGTGPAYQTNVQPDVISNIQEEIRLMKQTNSTDGDDDSSNSRRNSPSSDRNGWDKDRDRPRTRRGRGRGRQRRDPPQIPTVGLLPRHPKGQVALTGGSSGPQDEPIVSSSLTSNGSQTADDDGTFEQEDRAESSPRIVYGSGCEPTLAVPGSPRTSHSSRDSSPTTNNPPLNQKPESISNAMSTTATVSHPVEDEMQPKDTGSDRGHRRKPKQKHSHLNVQHGKSEELENEYNWQRLKVEAKVKKVLKSMTSLEKCEMKIADLKEIIYSEPSKLEPLPGPKELHVCLEEVLLHTVENKSFIPQALRVIDAIKDDEEFTVALSQIFAKLQSEYVRVTTNVVTQRHMKTFAELAGHMFVLADTWTSPSRDTVAVCVTNTFERWCIFNKGNQHPSPAKLHKIYVTCLSALMEVAGDLLESRWPAKMDEGFSVLEAKSQSSDLPMKVRSLMTTLLDKRRTGWPKVKCPTQEVAAETSEPNITESRQSNAATKDVPLMVEVATNTKQSVLNACTQTVIQMGSRDPYAAIRHMLYQLNMETLLEKFTSNAVRDTLLQMEFSELRILLKEIGLLPGHIWEIKHYLETKDKSEQALTYVGSSRSSSVGADDRLSRSRTSTLAEDIDCGAQFDTKSPPKVTLLSPECFQGPPVASTVGATQTGDVYLAINDNRQEEVETVSPDLSDVQPSTATIITETIEKGDSYNKSAIDKSLSSEGPTKKYSLSGIRNMISGWLNTTETEESTDTEVCTMENEGAFPEDVEPTSHVEPEDTDQTEPTRRYLPAGAENQGDPSEPSEQEIRYYQNMFKDVIILNEDEVAGKEELDDQHLEAYTFETHELERDMCERDGSHSPALSATPPPEKEEVSPPGSPSPSFINRPRHCTACGSMDHVIYDCPDKHSKFFI